MRLAFRRSTDSADSPPYLSLLKLHSAPFGSKGGADLFYADAERTQYLDMLQHLTQYSEELLLVVGNEGIGKSILLDKYLQRREEHWEVCRIDGNQGLELDSLFARVADCFAVDMAKVAPEQLLEALRRHLDALLEQQLSVLVIDDAHALSDDALEMVFHLAALEGEHGKLIRVLLFADSSIESRLSSTRFSQLASPHRVQLKPLNEADSAAYVTHRLQSAGYIGTPPFNSAELKQLYRQSQGVPLKLNRAAHALLLEHSEGERKQFGITRNNLRVGLATAALVGTVLGMHDRINAFLGGGESSVAVTAERPVLRLADEDNPWAVVIRDGESIQISCGTPGEQAVAVRPSPAAAPLEQQPVMKAPLLQELETPAEEPPAEAEAVVVKPPLPGIAPELPPVVAAADAPQPVAEGDSAEEKPAEPTAPEKLELTGIVPDPVIGSDEPQSVTLLGTGLESGSKVAVSSQGKVSALTPEQIKVPDSHHMELNLTTGMGPSKWAVQVSSPANVRSNIFRFEVEAPKPEAPSQEAATEQVEAAPAAPRPLVEKAEPAAESVAEAKPEPKPAAEKKPLVQRPATTSGLIQNGDWVGGQPAGNFTLQLLAAAEPESLQAFVAKNPKLKGPFGGFEQQRGGKRLHVLIQGSYPSRAQADAAARALPPPVKAWVRDFGGIQKVMEKPVKAAQAPVGGAKDTAWVWSQNPSHHTIQLAGSGNEATLKAMMGSLKLPGEMAVVESQRDGKPWYTLIYGSFASKAAAQGTVARLPASLKKSAPWIRTFSALQGEISAAGKR